MSQLSQSMEEGGVLSIRELFLPFDGEVIKKEVISNFKGRIGVTSVKEVKREVRGNCAWNERTGETRQV
jgi:hypothetical protein